MGWLRTSRQGHRTQVVLTFNPPTTPEGEWIVQFFAPWLDPNAPNPAQPGELRWYVRYKDEDLPVSSGALIEIDGIEYAPKSRTFIPARVEDNPVLMRPSGKAHARFKPHTNEALSARISLPRFTISVKSV